MQLAKDARDGKTGGVRVNTDWAIGIEVTEDGGHGKMVFELIKGSQSKR